MSTENKYTKPVGFLAEAIFKLYKASNQKGKDIGSFIIWGDPGIGKSAIAKKLHDQVQKLNKTDFSMIDYRLNKAEATDLGGYPTRNEESQSVDFLPLSKFNLPKDWKGVILLDELNTARPDVLSASYQVVLDRVMSDRDLPEGAIVLACCNYDTGSVNVNELGVALSTRAIHLYAECNIDEWVKWGQANDVNPNLLAFLKNNPGYLFDMSNRTSDSEPFPNPRTWEKVGMLYDSFNKGVITSDEFFVFGAGAVGTSAFANFKSILPKIEEIGNIQDYISGKKEIPSSASELFFFIIFNIASQLMSEKRQADIQDIADGGTVNIDKAFKRYSKFLELLFAKNHDEALTYMLSRALDSSMPDSDYSRHLTNFTQKVGSNPKYREYVQGILG